MESELGRYDQMSFSGMIGDEKLVCEYFEGQTNKGVWFGDNPLNHNITSVLAFQIVLIFLVSRITHFLLRPCHQTLRIAQIMAGIIVGPLLLGRNNASFEMLFPTASRMTLATFAEFGMIIYFFKMGVEVDPTQILKIEKRAIVIGLVGHICSVGIGSAVLQVVERTSSLGSEKKGIRDVVLVSALTSFPGISSFLREMNILNSEIGRMALSTSMVSDACMWVSYYIIISGIEVLVQKSYKEALKLAISICYFSILYFLLRPFIIWISNRNPQGKPITERNFMLVICILLVIGFSSQVIGQPSFIVAFWFGLILPDTPPLGSGLAERLDTVGSTLIIPAYCTISGLRTSIPNLATSKSASIEIILIATYFGKFVGTIFPSNRFQIEFRDSLSLGLIMCCKGLTDLCLLNILLNLKAIGDLSFSLSVYTMVAITGFATIVIYYVYDPSRRYKTYIRRSIINSPKDLDLKILVCVHNEENVYPMINLLRVSNPTNATPISVFVLHLMELSGRSATILTKNEYKHHTNSYKETSTQHISNVFHQFQMHYEECVLLQCFTAVAPYSTMHDDICYMTMDAKCNIVIIPFHKQWSMNGSVEVSNASIRSLNQKVLNKAPCSIGVLIDRSQMSGQLLVINEESICEIAMIFLGGADDQEALAYSIRMAQHSNIRLTVFWIRVQTQQKQWNVKNPYIDLMEHIRYSINLKGKVKFKEETVEDGEGTTQVIRENIEGHFSLVIVGKHHIADSPCILGLLEWCELPELGPFGNLLATSDFTFSVLVVQQQPFNNQFSWTNSKRNEAAMNFWAIWKRSNDKVWEGTMKPTTLSHQYAHDYLREWELARQQPTRSINTTVGVAVPHPRWHKPAPSTLKCNVDAALFDQDSKFGIGICIRDENGVFLWKEKQCGLKEF